MFNRLRFPALIALFLLAFAVQPAAGQDDPFLATTNRVANVRTGPGATFSQIGTIPDAATVRITQRNRVGTWLYVQYPRADGSIALEGWVFRGVLRLSQALRFSEVYENSAPADADPAALPALSRLLSAPVIPRLEGELLANVQAIFERGQAMGRRADAFTKVGDSLSADPRYLDPMARSPIELGPYDFLAETIGYYAVSAGERGTAAEVGMGTYTVLDPQWANPSQCAGGETPLACDFRIKQPSIALIQFGSNDILHVSVEYFAEQYRRIVEETINAGVIPVLFTFSYRENGPLWRQSVAFNSAILDIGDELDIPVINLWLAARPLPDYGLDVDGVHMLQSGYDTLKFNSAEEAWYGASLRNLLAIRTLHEIRRMLDLPASLTAEVTPESTAAGG